MSLPNDLDAARERLKEGTPPQRDQLTPREVAQRTGLSYSAVLRAIRRGDLQACQPVPGRLRIEVAEYERWRTTPHRPPGPPSPERPRRGGQRSGDGRGFASQLRAIEGGE